jgi:hypothetical protein
MEKSKVIHLEKANTLSSFLTEEERENIVSLKITGYIGREDFDDVLDDMCDSCGLFDENDDYTPDYELASALRHLDLGEATYVDGDCLPYFGFHTLLETAILPRGIKSTQEECETALSESENLRTLILPEGLKIVDGFNSCPKLTGLILPEGLEVIESHAFCGCESITAIRIPASVKSISGSSFAGCNIAAYEVDENNPYYTVIDGVIYSKDLKTLVAFPSAYPKKHYIVPNTTVIIGEHAFMDSHIESVEIPNGLTTIQEWSFEGSHIQSIDMPDTVTSIGEGAFRFCFELEHVGLPTVLTEIPRQTFESCPRLKELSVPSSVRTIHYSSLIWSHGIEKLVLQDGLEEIADDGIMIVSDGNIKEVTLPKTLKKVPGGVFNYSPHIKLFSLDPENPYFTIIDEALCSKDGKILFSVPNYHRESYTVPEGIEVIGARAFAYLPRINSITLPSTLRVIESRAFQGDDALKSITIPANVEKIEVYALWADNLKKVIMECSVPPKMTGVVRDDEWIYKDVSLFVPHESVELYKQAPGWKCFRVKEFKE